MWAAYCNGRGRGVSKGGALAKRLLQRRGQSYYQDGCDGVRGEEHGTRNEGTEASLDNVCRWRSKGCPASHDAVLKQTLWSDSDITSTCFCCSAEESSSRKRSMTGGNSLTIIVFPASHYHNVQRLLDGWHFRLTLSSRHEMSHTGSAGRRRRTRRSSAVL